MREAVPAIASIRPVPMQRVAALSALVLLLAWSSHCARAATNVPQERASARQIVATLLANEDAASLHRDHYMFLSEERSDRTGEHLWTEKVVETNAGVVRMLLTEDGKPLSPERAARERKRLAEIAADPAAFARRSRAQKDDEDYARRMEWLVGSAYNFSETGSEDGYLRIDFTPNPNFRTQSFVERVMHGMSGTMLIDPKTMRLHRLEGRLVQDVSLGWGILARIRAGSRFDVTRDHPGVPGWKMTEYDTDFSGRILFFKSIVLNSHAVHSDFVCVPNNISVAQAVALVEK
jgi:hypothetical protein